MHGRGFGAGLLIVFLLALVCALVIAAWPDKNESK
jgi:hypothetical protein